MKFFIFSLIIGFIFISCTPEEQKINNNYNLSVTLNSDLKISIVWDSLTLASSIKYYELYKSTNKDADYVKLSTINLDKSLDKYNYIDDFIIDARKTYYYKVRAITIISNEEFSEILSYKAVTDIDGDGSIEDDCAANINTISPNELELCDGIDNNCSGSIDDGVEDIITGIGVGECQEGITKCINGVMTVVQVEIKPKNEFCDGKDNNCNNEIDENTNVLCPNACGDAGVKECINGVLQECNAPLVPVEICNGEDEDCDGVNDNGFLDTDNDSIANCVDDDDDGDGENDDTDCEPLNKNNFNGNIEVCDGSDNNCNDLVDEDFSDLDHDSIADCVDDDDDGDGDRDVVDCQPLNKDVFHGQIEICDNVDNNCNAIIDENLFKLCSNVCETGEAICIEGHWLGCDASVSNAGDWTSNSPLKRTNFAKTQIKSNTLFIFSGELSSGELSDELWSYNTVSKTWKKIITEGVLPIPRSFGSLSYKSTTDELYLYGGVDSDGNTLSDFWKFDIETGLWVAIDARGEIPPELSALSLFSDNYDNIILFGGKVSNSLINENTYKYSTSENRWYLIDYSLSPTARYNHSIIYNAKTNSLFMFGGNISENSFSNELWKFNLNTFDWSLESDDFSVPNITNTSMYSKDSNIYALGGLTESNLLSLTFYKYNLNTQTWRIVTLQQDNIVSSLIIGDGSDLVSIWGGNKLDNSISTIDINFDLDSETYNIENNISTIYKASVTYNIINNKNYLFGGFNGQEFSNDLWEYSQNNNTWDKVYLSNQPEPREGASITFNDSDNHIYLYGGNDASHNYGDLWILDVETMFNWEKLSITDGPSYRKGAYLFYRRGEIYLFGGTEGGVTSLDLYKLNKNESKWEKIDYINTPPELRENYSVIYSPENNYLFLFAGNKNGIKQNDLWSLDIDTKTWINYSIGIVKPSQRDNSYFLYDYNKGSVYLFGGVDENDNYLADLWSLEIGSSNWTIIKPNSSFENFNKRDGLSTFFVNNQNNHYIYVLGGKSVLDYFYLPNKLNLICE